MDDKNVKYKILFVSDKTENSLFLDVIEATGLAPNSQRII